MHFMSVGAHLSRTLIEEDPGVVHEHVEPLIIPKDGGAERANLLERREVGRIERSTPLALGHDLLHERCTALAIAPVDDDVRAAGGETSRNLAAKAVGGSRDHDDLLARSRTGLLLLGG